MSNKDKRITGYKEFSYNQLADMFWGIYSKPHKFSTLNYDETFELLDFLYSIAAIHDNSYFSDEHDHEEANLLNIAKEISDHENERNETIVHPMITHLTNRIDQEFEGYTETITNVYNKPNGTTGNKLYAKHIGLIYHYNNNRLPTHGSIEGNETLTKELEIINVKYKNYLEKPLVNIQSFSTKYKRYEGKNNRTGRTTKRELITIKKDIECVLPFLNNDALKIAKQELSEIEEKISTFY